MEPDFGSNVAKSLRKYPRKICTKYGPLERHRRKSKNNLIRIAECALLILPHADEQRIAAEATTNNGTVMVHLWDEPVTGSATLSTVRLRLADCLQRDTEAVLLRLARERLFHASRGKRLDARKRRVWKTSSRRPPQRKFSRACDADFRKDVVGLTEIRSDHPTYDISDSIPPEDAFLIALQLRDFPDHKYWEEGRQFPVFSLRAGWSTLHDLKRDPRFLIDKPFHSVHLYFPHEFLNAIADAANAPHIGDLRYEPGTGVDDQIVRALTSVLYPALDRPDEANQLFVHGVMLAIGCHIAQTYGGLTTIPMRGGLAPWQERRAKEIIEANLSGDVQLAQLAQECGLSTGHFSRAFKHTIGIPPHQWLLHRRIENAMRLLRTQQLSLSEVALACGFSDQSHFTRVFMKFSGTSPGAWQRLHRK